MSLFRSSLRPPAVLSDETVERYLADIRRGLQPDPLFRRRLRGHVVNRHVAAREGQAVARGTVAREMSRIGRAVLYASFALGLSVTGAMAASQQAIPGDPFYALKLQVERIRVEIVPPHLLDELAAYSLGQRVEELGRLADAGDWSAFESHIAAVDTAYGALVAATPDRGALTRNLRVSESLLERLPAAAHARIERALANPPRPAGDGQDDGSGGVAPDRAGGPAEPPSGSSSESGPDGGAPGQSPTPNPNRGPRVRPEPTSLPEPQPTKAAKPDRSPPPSSMPDVDTARESPSP